MKLLPLLALAGAAAAQDPAREKEMALGERLASDIRKHHQRSYADPAWTYVNNLVRRLTPAGPRLQVDLIVDDLGGPTCEPLLVPGYLFVPERLFLKAWSEAEFAGMLAHAIAHSVDRHSLPLPNAAQQRALELDADRRAVAMLVAAGLNPRALLDYIERTQPETVPNFLRLPGRAERIAAMEEALARLPAPAEVIESSSSYGAAQEQARVSIQRRIPRPPSLFRR